MIGRRDLVAILGGALVAPVGAALAQQKPVPTVGYLSGASPNSFPAVVRAFKAGLAQGGYRDGETVTIAFRWAEGHYDKFPQLARELVDLRPAVIVAPGSADSAVAIKSLTSTIPIVFNTDIDPIKLGLAASYNHPGGNATGVNTLFAEMTAKRIGLFHQLAPHAKVVAALLNPTRVGADTERDAAETAARTLNLELHILHATNDAELNAALASLAGLKADGLIIGSDSWLTAREAQEAVVAYAVAHKLPALANVREFAAAGGLMSYGPNVPAIIGELGVVTAKILAGANPADMPITQPTRFYLVINRKTAAALGIDIPPTLLAIADEVIE
jgi:putative tryptophan/tyrosine transport system substrate-binding protein